MRQFAISDIHGCAATFKALLKQIGFGKTDELYILGDYVDRGPDSKGVIDHIWDLQQSGHQVHCLKGNHEEMMIKAGDHVPSLQSWMNHGGVATNKSFGVIRRGEIPQQYISWMKSLPHFFEIEGYILVHAGLNFQKKDPMEDQHNMLWIRNWYQFIDKDWLKGRIIVHGHTPIPKEKIEEQLLTLSTRRILDIDSGCTFVEQEYGCLCAFDLRDKKLYFEKRCE